MTPGREVDSYAARVQHLGNGEPVTRVVPARVGLVGNPSDGFGGAVLATVVPPLAATVTATVADHVAFDGAGASLRWPSLGDWLAAVGAEGHGDEQRLISAALWTLVRHVGTRRGRGVELGWTTTVPRSVGLAGSSALAVGVIDATAAAWRIHLDRRVVAALALRAEREVLGIAAGWQDRIVQSFGRTVLVDAAEMHVVDGVEVPSVSVLDDHGIGVLVGWSAADAASSDSYHAPLRRSPEALAAPMSELAELARNAAVAWAHGDASAVGSAMDAGWAVRQACAPLRDDHTALVELVRSTGAHATTPGSGGSVVAVSSDPATLVRAADVLAANGHRSVTVAG
jgi:glucuronokinase